MKQELGEGESKSPTPRRGGSSTATHGADPGDLLPSRASRGGGTRVHRETQGRALHPTGLDTGSRASAGVPAAAPRAPGRARAAYLDGLAGPWRGRGSASGHQPRRRRGALAARGSGRWPRGGSGDSSALPSGTQTWGARRAALHPRCKRSAWSETQGETVTEDASESPAPLCPTHRFVPHFPLLPLSTPQP